MKPGARAVEAARRALGARFRLHGRDPATGLDCVGLAALALRAEGFAGEVPSGYALRRSDIGKIVRQLAGSELTRCYDSRPGDLLLCAVDAGQLHMAIASETGIIHADAMLRRVVERPGEVPWPVLGRWRVQS
ncbi:peptidoglycan endopeptidase [Sphingosinithalassobacter sp. LHW66-3]|uniref:peptidoglycan endopeptidase n=1 Tax=Sphingosinithalassobacter sp. LHW66-3 TaxID=3424718 RepID=UPI003D6BDE81